MSQQDTQLECLAFKIPAELYVAADQCLFDDFSEDDLYTNSEIKCTNRQEAQFVAEYLSQFDCSTRVSAIGCAVIYRSK